jgi:hypothetical protein
VSRDPFPADIREQTAPPRGPDRGPRFKHRSQSIDNSDSRDTEPQIGPGRDQEAPLERQATPNDPRDSSRAYCVRDRVYLLRDSQVASLRDIGRFRVVAVSDLSAYRYGGDRARVERDLRSLAKVALIKDRTIEVSRTRMLRVVTLTKTGQRLLSRSNLQSDSQPVYHGLKKPREVAHDADLYKLYQKEVGRITKAGGKPLRVLLDYELKKHLNRDLARMSPQEGDPKQKAVIADSHALPIVGGRIAVPDLRVEYETREGELQHVDLELATRSYRPRAVAAKASAGFSIYGRAGDVSRLRRVLDEREITAEIFTL